MDFSGNERGVIDRLNTSSAKRRRGSWYVQQIANQFCSFVTVNLSVSFILICITAVSKHFEISQICINKKQNIIKKYWRSTIRSLPLDLF